MWASAAPAGRVARPTGREATACGPISATSPSWWRTIRLRRLRRPAARCSARRGTAATGTPGPGMPTTPASAASPSRSTAPPTKHMTSAIRRGPRSVSRAMTRSPFRATTSRAGWASTPAPCPTGTTPCAWRAPTAPATGGWPTGRCSSTTTPRTHPTAPGWRVATGGTAATGSTLPGATPIRATRHRSSRRATGSAAPGLPATAARAPRRATASPRCAVSPCPIRVTGLCGPGWSTPPGTSMPGTPPRPFTCGSIPRSTARRSPPPIAAIRGASSFAWPTTPQASRPARSSCAVAARPSGARCRRGRTAAR